MGGVGLIKFIVFPFDRNTEVHFLESETPELYKQLKDALINHESLILYPLIYYYSGIQINGQYVYSNLEFNGRNLHIPTYFYIEETNDDIRLFASIDYGSGAHTSVFLEYNKNNNTLYTR